MANLSGTYFSAVMQRNMRFTAILSNDNTVDPEVNPHYARPKKNVYLLHGYCGCDSDWGLNAPLCEVANKYNVNFFMPTGENSFYLDQPATGFKYAEYVGKEFIEYTRKTFNLSCEKEDTFIGGYSMGGFGAIHTALAYPENFSRVIALSSALIVNGLVGMKPGTGNPVANYDYYHQMFGDLDHLKETASDPEFLMTELLNEGKSIPAMFLACGTDDGLITTNRAFCEFMDAHNVPYTFVTEPGHHDFDFWRKHLVTGLEWAL